MRRMRFSPRSSFARTLLLIVTLLFVSLVTTYLVVLNFAILPSLQQFNKVLAYEVRMLMTARSWLFPRRFVVKSTVNWASRSIRMKRRKTRVCAGRSTMNSSASRWRSSWVARRKCASRSTKARPLSG